MKKYQSYKASKIEWLGQIPSHWELHKAKFIFKKENRPTRENDEVITAFRDGTVTLRKNKREEGFTYSIKEIGYQGVRKDDLIIHEMDGFAGAIGVSDSDGKCSPVYSVCTPSKKALTKYYGFLIREMANTNYITALAKGIRQRSTDFRFNTFGNLFLPYFSYPEQTTISNFLDYKTKLVDMLIAQKEKHIELIKEYRQAVITQAVTKGLDPNVKMKDSGIEWLGKIPENWKNIRLKFLCSIKTGKRNTEDNIEGGQYPFFVRSDTVERINSYSYDGEAILTAGDGVGVARVFHYYNGKFDYHQRVYKFSDFNNIDAKYLFYFTKENLVKEVIKLSAKTTVDSLRLPMLQNFTVCTPPLSEQYRIVEYLDKKSKSIDKSLDKAVEQIQNLKEYRSSLISSAVTGKIDVRDYNIPKEYLEEE